MLRLRDLTVKDVMTATPFCIGVEVPLPKAYAQLVGRGYSGAPVIREGSLAGVVSAHDLLANSASAVFMGDATAEELSAKTVADVVGGVPLTCRGEMPLGEACGLMVKNRAHRLVVVEEDGSPAGILSSIDVVRAVACFNELEVDSAERFATIMASLTAEEQDQV